MEKKFRQIQERTMVLFCVLLVTLASFLTFLYVTSSNYNIRKNAASLVTANNREMELNIDNYLDKVQEASDLLFSDPMYYTYDPTKENTTRYDQLQARSALETRIMNLGILDNYTDFFVLYSNNDRVGWSCQTTVDMFSDLDMYAECAKVLDNAQDSSDHSKADAFVFQLNGNLDHIYYLKRYNENAIILISFFTKELENYFEIPDQLTGMQLCLVDRENTIIYSNDADSIGQSLDPEVVQTLGDLVNGSVLTKKILITTDECRNSWRVICTLPTSILVRDNTRFLWHSLVVVILMVLLILVFAVREVRLMNVSANEIVDSLQDEAVHDRMTGLLRKEIFPEEAEKILEVQDPARQRSFTILDLDNFKQVNDTMGHLAGDQVIRSFADCLSKVFGSEFILGRLGGDEFGVLGNLEVESPGQMQKEMEKYLTALRKSFNEDLGQKYSAVSLNFSSGTVGVKDSKEEFSSLYERADHLLYEAKRAHKGQDRYDFGGEVSA